VIYPEVSHPPDGAGSPRHGHLVMLGTLSTEKGQVDAVRAVAVARRL